MRDVCVCVPARNEAERLPVLLNALARQTLGRPLRVCLCINNSDDGAASVALEWASTSRHSLVLDIIERTFEPALAHAGSARRAAMDRGAEWLADDTAVLVSTDADCRPPEHWIASILAAFQDDDLIVGGRIVLDDAEAPPPVLLALQARCDAYWTRVRAIEDAIDPVSWDPPPRHGDHTGASLALSVGLYRKTGGVPLLATGEDRALVEAALGGGGRLVHPPTVWTAVSARTVGRAQSGMADGMRQLAQCAAAGTAPRVPSFEHWVARATWRSEARRQAAVADLLLKERSLPPMPCDMPLPDIR